MTLGNKHFIRIGAAVLLYAATIYMLRPGARQASAMGPDGQPATEVGPTFWQQPKPVSAQDRVHWKQTEERIQHLAVQEQDHAKRERALKDMPTTRRQLQLGAMAAWSTLIQTNMSLFHELYQKAKEAEHGETACTVCDGYSYMPCIMCKDHDGKCLTCNGTGHRSFSEFCPSCLGTARCYMCTGRGKMFCPFCDDGMIKVRWPLPHYFPPGG